MTNVCNQKCPHCFGFYPERDQARICLDEAKRIIEQIVKAGARGMTFTGGGDPLVNPATPEAVAYAASLGIDVGFITNAQSLKAQTAEILLRSCVWLRVSVDAASAEIFHKTHGMGPEQYEQVLANVRMLVRLKRELGSRTTLGIGFLTSPETKQDIHAFGALGKSLGVDYAQYRPLLRRQGEAEIDYSDSGILDEMLRARRDFSDDSYRVVCSEHKYRLIAERQLDRSYRKCYGQNFATVIGADKKMYVCCHMRGIEKYVIGDLEKASVEEIWNSEHRKKVADSVDFRDCPPLCRCDSFNNILWDIKDGGQTLDSAPSEQEWEHKNFI